jgi:hypothetical protein
MTLSPRWWIAVLIAAGLVFLVIGQFADSRLLAWTFNVLGAVALLAGWIVGARAQLRERMRHEQERSKP